MWNGQINRNLHLHINVTLMTVGFVEFQCIRLPIIRCQKIRHQPISQSTNCSLSAFIEVRCEYQTVSIEWNHTISMCSGEKCAPLYSSAMSGSEIHTDGAFDRWTRNMMASCAHTVLMATNTRSSLVPRTRAILFWSLSFNIITSH